jgi:hypothetical protein
LAAMAHRGNAEFLQIFVSEMTQYFSADFILAESRLVLFQA